MVVEINGIELNYEMAGDGEPLLWLHGFMGAGPDWKYIFKEPPAGFRLIAPDLRGHGASTNPSGEFSFRQAADDVGGIAPSSRARHSEGHRPEWRRYHLASHGDAARPTRIESMVIVSAPPYFPGAGSGTPAADVGQRCSVRSRWI